jgi:tight adherence protein C
MLLIIIVAVFVSVALLAGVFLYPALSRKEAVRQRVDQLAQQEAVKPTLMPTPRKWQVFLGKLGVSVKAKPADLGTYRAILTAAGFRRGSVYIFLGSQLFLTLLLPGCYLMLVVTPYVKMGKMAMLVALALAIAGYFIPSVCLNRLAEHRKTEVFHSLPDVLDLLTVCVEAGLSLDAALVKTAEHFIDSNNPLISELHTVTLEISAGKPRFEAIRGLAERTGVDDIRSFASMMVQSEKFGTSMGKTMRTYAESLRVRRRQLAEERAAKTAIKMLFPLTFCVFPALLVVMLAPALFKIYSIFNK